MLMKRFMSAISLFEKLSDIFTFLCSSLSYRPVKSCHLLTVTADVGVMFFRQLSVHLLDGGQLSAFGNAQRHPPRLMLRTFR